MIKRIFRAFREILAGKPAHLRSSKWEALEKRFLSSHPTCAACGETKSLQVHHVQPFHLHPELELEESNLITLCEFKGGRECHLHIGHNGNWKNFNPNVLEDARASLEKIR